MFLSWHTYRPQGPVTPRPLNLHSQAVTQSPLSHSSLASELCLGIFPFSLHSPRPPSQGQPGWVLLSVCPWGPRTSSHDLLLSRGDTPLLQQSAPASARAQRHLRSADPAAQGFHRPSQNVGTCICPTHCPGQCLPQQGAAGHSTPGRADPHSTREGEELALAG